MDLTFMTTDTRVKNRLPLKGLLRMTFCNSQPLVQNGNANLQVKLGVNKFLQKV